MKDNHVAIVLERMEGKLDAFAEAMSGLPAGVAQLKEDVAQIKADSKATQAVVKDHSRQLDEHNEKLAGLTSIASA